MAVAHSSAEEQNRPGSRAIVIGGGLAGLASARVLSDLFDEVTLLERDAITQQASLLYFSTWVELSCLPLASFLGILLVSVP